MKVQGFAVFKAKGKLNSFAYEAKALGAEDCLIKISHCGICHSDIHLIDNDWGVSAYPLIPGHEVIGIVEDLGPQVRHLKKGMRVGVGWQAGCCHACEWCKAGDENLCEKSQATCVKHHGGYAGHILVDSRLAFLIPSELDSQGVAPLLCAGITVFSPLKRLGVNSSTKVGVIGMGGLGHLAVQFASAMGAQVTVFSTSVDKKIDALSLGAEHFVLTTDKGSIKKARNSIDVLISVVTVDLKWTDYFDLLRQNGRLVILGASPSDMKISPGMLLSQQKGVIGSNTGGIPMIRDMLAFAAHNQIEAKTKVFPLSKVNEAITAVRKNKARYRIVLDCNK